MKQSPNDPEPTRATQDFATVCGPLRGLLRKRAEILCRSNPHLVDDLVQETYVHALRSWDHFQPEESASAWLCRIMHRLCIDWYRRHMRHEEALLERAAESSGSIPPEPTGMSRRVLYALDQLEPEWRAVVYRADILGESYREIADELGMAVGTVKSRLHRAHRMLAEIITP